MNRCELKTTKYYFALYRGKEGWVCTILDTSREELQRRAAAHGFEIIGDIVERETEL